MAVNPSFFDQMRGFKWTPDEAEEIKRFIEVNTERQVQTSSRQKWDAGAAERWMASHPFKTWAEDHGAQPAQTTKVETDYHNGEPMLTTTVYGGIAGGRTQCDANSPHKLLREQRDRLLKMMNSGEISLLDVTMELFITLGMLEQQIPIGTGR